MSTYVFYDEGRDEMIIPSSDEVCDEWKDIYVWEWDGEKGMYKHVARGCHDGRYYIDDDMRQYERVDLEELLESDD